MKYLKLFESFNEYEISWENILPLQLTIIQRQNEVIFKRGNIMRNPDMVQCSYDCDKFGFPSTLEFDFYFSQDDNDGTTNIDVDITLGDAMVSEFTLITPNTVKVTEYTSFHSKTDPSNTVFAFTDQSLSELVKTFNQLDGFKFTVDDFKFLDNRDNYTPN